MYKYSQICYEFKGFVSWVSKKYWHWYVSLFLRGCLTWVQIMRTTAFQLIAWIASRYCFHVLAWTAGKQRHSWTSFNPLPPCAKPLQSCLTLCNPLDRSPPRSSMGFSRHENWIGLLFPPLGDLPDPGIKPTSLSSAASQAGSLPLAQPGRILSRRESLEHCLSSESNLSTYSIGSQRESWIVHFWYIPIFNYSTWKRVLVCFLLVCVYKFIYIY